MIVRAKPIVRGSARTHLGLEFWWTNKEVGIKNERIIIKES